MDPKMTSSSGNKTRGTVDIDVTWFEEARVPTWTWFIASGLMWLLWAFLKVPSRTTAPGIPLWSFMEIFMESPYQQAIREFKWDMLCHGFWAIVFPACLMFIEWVYPRMFSVRHRYVFLRDLPSPDFDTRADQISLSTLKHKPAYCEVRYFRCWLGWEYKNSVLTVSHELLAQICTARNMPSGADARTVRQKLELSSSSLSTVNLNRYDSPRGKQCVQDSQRLAFGLWMEMEQRLSSVPFPSPPVAK